MADTINFDVVLPAVADEDVENREVTVTVAGGEPQVQTVAKDAVSVSGFSGAQGAEVKVSLVDLDDGDPPNRSEPSEGTFTLADTFAPAKPGELSLKATSES